MDRIRRFLRLVATAALVLLIPGGATAALAETEPEAATQPALILTVR